MPTALTTTKKGAGMICHGCGIYLGLMLGTPVQIQIECEDIDARLSQKAKLAAVDMRLDQGAHGGFRQMPRRSDTRNLKQRAGGGNVRIEP